MTLIPIRQRTIVFGVYLSLAGLLLWSLEAVYMEFHYARHEKISLRCPLEVFIAFTCANRNEIPRRVLFHVGQFDRYEISCRGKIDM